MEAVAMVYYVAFVAAHLCIYGYHLYKYKAVYRLGFLAEYYYKSLAKGFLIFSGILLIGPIFKLQESILHGAIALGITTIAAICLGQAFALIATMFKTEWGNRSYNRVLETGIVIVYLLTYVGIWREVSGAT